MVPDIVLSISWVPQSILCGFYTRSQIHTTALPENGYFYANFTQKKTELGEMRYFLQDHTTTTWSHWS